MQEDKKHSTPEILYRIKNVEGLVMMTDERTSPIIVFPTICDASEDIEKRLGLKADDEGGYLAYIPASKMKGYERFERRQRFWESVRQTLDIRKYFVR